jgi:hypothetical protein
MRDGSQGAVPEDPDAELSATNTKKQNYTTTGSKNT